MSTPEPRLPYAPLEEYILARHKPDPDMTHTEHGARGIGDILGVGSNVVYRWRRLGTVDIYAADRAAVALGQHAWAIWGDEWWAA